MEHTNRDTAQNAAPQNDWQDAKPIASVDESTTEENEIRSADPPRNDDESIHAMAGIDAPDPDDEDDEDDDDEAGDWGHVDPAEGNSPFPDPNEPGFPGSAV